MQLSSGLMNRLKWKQALLVNGIPRYTNYRVVPGDVITVLLDEPAPDYPAQDGPLDIIYEDDDILVADKPAGMLIHPSHAQFSGTLANYVAGYFRRTGQNCAFHPITRLDRDTFGLVLLAKNAVIHHAFDELHTQNRFHQVYHAVVYGCPPKPEGLIDAPIARCPLPSLLREIRSDGKPSRTRYKVLQQYDGCTKLSLELLTGRTHQLRLHCAHIGCPILGDPQYGSTESREFSLRFHLKSQLLCAHELFFPHPVTGEPVHLFSHLDAELPDFL